MTQQSYEENRFLLESYRSARQRLYAYMRKLEAGLREARDAAETDSLERRLLVLYGELDDTASAIRTLEEYCRAAGKALSPQGEEPSPVALTLRPGAEVRRTENQAGRRAYAG